MYKYFGERFGGRLEVLRYRATTDLDEELDDGFHDVKAFPVHPDQGGDVPHVEMPILVDQLVEDADWSISTGPNDKETVGTAAAGETNKHCQRSHTIV